MKTTKEIQDLALRHKNMILLPAPAEKAPLDGTAQATMFQAEIMRLGYTFSEELFHELSLLTADANAGLFRQVIPLLWKFKGANKDWRLFYKNFPKQVLRASEFELFNNALAHYWTCGEWLPDYPVNRRLPALEKVKLQTLHLGTWEKFTSIFTELLGSNGSLSESDQADLKWLIQTYGNDLAPFEPVNIPFKEQLALYVGLRLELGLDIDDRLQTSTDVLRVLTQLSKGDLSLAENTKFRSWKRSERRLLLGALEKVITEDDLARHAEKWKRAFHGLHVGDYAKAYPKTYRLADKLRNQTLRSYASRVEAALLRRDAQALLELLSKRPGELARRLDHLLRILEPADISQLLLLFRQAALEVDTRVLVQILAHFNQRTETITQRLVLPKGKISKARVLKTPLTPLPTDQVAEIIDAINSALVQRFSQRASLGKVWIDERLKKCPLALSQRSASEALRTVARGTRLPLSDKKTLRMFVWWVGQDVDLSAVLYDQNFKKKGHLSYTNLRYQSINACHSGDIVNAPQGAAEFIDIDLDLALDSGIRYITMSVLDFTGQRFANYAECFVGWMTRDYPDSNEVYDPKTVEQKIDLRTETTLAAPVVFDLKTREAIWLDLSSNTQVKASNNVESRSATLQDLTKAGIDLNKKTSLYDLFSLHVKARGEQVEHPEQADTLFGLNEGITPFDIHKINSEYL